MVHVYKIVEHIYIYMSNSTTAIKQYMFIEVKLHSDLISSKAVSFLSEMTESPALRLTCMHA